MLSYTNKYSYNDIAIMPSNISYINSRSEIDIKTLPIFTAPMASVVDADNFKEFKNNKITPIIPRNINLSDRLEMMYYGEWIAMSLKEFEHYFVTNINDNLKTFGGTCKVCIDIANGHMRKLYILCEQAKLKATSYELVIMAGNIANPATYYTLSKYNSEFKIVDYIRLGIGGGSGCITTSNTGIHYPIASLIAECVQYKTEKSPKIIADGGIRNYSDVIKALALGADYVMIGSLLAQCEESAGEKILKDGKKYVKFFGMASADGQKAIQGEKTKTAEGITKMLPVLYTLQDWSENMMDYLKSAMSYCNAKCLKEFKPNLYIISNNTYNSINK